MSKTQHFTNQKVEEIIKDFIDREFMYDKPEVVLANDLPLVEQGIIDSLGIIKLIGFLEEKFSFTVDPGEVLLENFETINALKSWAIAKIENDGHPVDDWERAKLQP